MVTRRSTRAGSAQPAAPAAAERRSGRLRSDSTASSERRASAEYLAYSSDDEFEEFISQPKTDYTYARSMSYNTISPQHVTPPNMSRRCLHSPGAAGMGVGAGRRDDRLDLELSRDVHDFSFSRELASRVTSSRTTTAATSAKGSLYRISGGLDVDSGDEDCVENNNISKSSSHESYKLTRETKTNRRTVTSVLLTLLYPFTYLWMVVSDTGRRLVWRQRTADTAPAPAPAPAAPQPGTVEYRRLMRGLPQLGTAAGGGGGGAQRHWSRSTGPQAAPARPETITGRVTRSVTTAVSRTVTTVVTSVLVTVTTVVSLLWWPVRQAAGAVSSAGRRSAAWARSAGEAADVPRRSARLLHCLSPRTWARAVGAGAGRAAAAVSSLSPGRLRRSAAAGDCVDGGAAHRGFAPVSWVRSALMTILTSVQWAATAAAQTVTGAASGAAGAVGSAASGTVSVLSSAARGTAGAFGGAARGTAGAAKGLVGSLAAAGGGAWRSVWPWAETETASGRHGAVLSPEEAGQRRRRLCLCLLPLLLLLLALLLPLLWGLYCEEDPVAAVAVDSQESATLSQLKAAPATAWTALRNTAAFVGTSTVDTASSVYGYLAMLGSSALLAVPAVEPEQATPSAAPVVPAFPVVPAVPAAAPAPPPPTESLTAVYARLEELQTKLAALQMDFQSCRAASEAATQPAAVRAALGLGSGQLLTAEQLAAAEQRQAEQLSAQLAAVRQQLEQSGAERQAAQRAELEARLAQLELTAGQLRQLQDGSERTEQRAAGLTDELARLQHDFSDLHRTLLAVQESLKQVRSCCNRTDPDWSTLLSQRLRSLESDLEGRLQGFAATIKEDLASESVSAAAAAAAAAAGSGGVSKEDVVLIAREALAQYDADKTGKFDYALESAGGSVISTKCTESYNVKSARISVLGIPLWYPSNNPRTIIQPSVSPGECFAFRGQGYFVISLSRRIEPTEFIMEHIPRNLTPTAAIDSAPRNFTVLGLRDGSDQEGVLLGRYLYRESGPPLQAFPARPAGATFSVVELRVHDNWGHRDYTCLYRFRVHGRPADTDADGGR
ncbi:uncharacterized protein LOC122365453 isoform X2 [Amphibalanus amphitrite]|nr:uncharacterized protein LOC122365453 isoform X2 [Amphibalanus amphitrite]